MRGDLHAKYCRGCKPFIGHDRIDYMLNGKVYRICAGTAAVVKVAAVKALNRMCIKVVSIAKDAGQDVILAVSNEHMVEVRVETLNPQLVRMCISAHQDEQNDIWTAAKIIAHTEHSLAQPKASYKLI